MQENELFTVWVGLLIICLYPADDVSIKCTAICIGNIIVSPFWAGGSKEVREHFSFSKRVSVLKQLPREQRSSLLMKGICSV